MATKRASLDEVLAFANKVREAGGGNPLDALMPAVPESSTQCLIAANLNFNCSVNRDYGEKWVMWTNKRVRDKIAAALNLKPIDKYDSRTKFGVVLPSKIGQVAADFDRWNAALTQEKTGKGKKRKFRLDKHATENERARLKEFWPYIKESKREAYAHAVLDEHGQLIL